MAAKPRKKRGKSARRTRGKQARSQSSPIDLWRSRGVGVFLLIVALFMGVSVVKEVVRRVETRYEIDTLEAEVARLQDRNTEMNDLIDLFSTSATQDKQARVKLGLQSPGEQVVLLPDRQDNAKIILPESDTITYISLNETQTNPQRWKQFLEEKISNSQE